MTNKKLVIFDLAGTIVDLGSSAPVEAFRAAFSKVNLAPTDELIRAYMGYDKQIHIEKIFTMLRGPNSDPAQNLYETRVVYREFLLALPRCISSADPIPGTEQVLQEVKGRGFAIATTTGYPAKFVAPALGDLKKYVDFSIAADQVSKSRPYPYMIFACMEALGIESVHRCVKVDDTPVGIEAGYNAGMSTIGVITGNSSPKALANSTFVMQTPSWDGFLDRLEDIC